MPKRKKSVTLLSNEQLALQGLEFINKKEQEKAITNELKTLRVSLEDAVMEIGSEDEKGNKYIILEHADKEIVLKETLRCGKSLLPEAIEVLKKNGFKHCIEKVEVIRESVLEDAILNGEIDESILSQIYGMKTSYAFSASLRNRFDGEIKD